MFNRVLKTKQHKERMHIFAVLQNEICLFPLQKKTLKFLTSVQHAVGSVGLEKNTLMVKINSKKDLIFQTSFR